MNHISRSVVSLLALAALMLIPQIAEAANDTATIRWVRTCPDGSGGQRVVINYEVVGSPGTFKTVFLGVDSAGTSPLTTIAVSALLSGRTVTVERASTAAAQCGVTALYGNSTSAYIQLN
jgi:hypothetical protein